MAASGRARGRREAKDSRRRSAVLTRPTRGLPQKRRILIVGDGDKTEHNYFNELRLDDKVRQRFALTVRAGKHGSARSTVEKAIEEHHKAKAGNTEPFDEVWCVMDVERPAHAGSLDEALADLTKVGNQEAKEGAPTEFFTALSNPCFEVWFLAHFVRTCRSFLGFTDVKKTLDNHWRGPFGCSYKKNQQGVYAKLTGKTDAAIKNAREVHEGDHERRGVESCNSSTEVYKLVQKLRADSGRT